MKPILQYAVMSLIFVPMLFITTDNGPLTPQFNRNDTLDNTTDTQSLESSDWYSKVIQNIKKDEYNITYSDGEKTYQSPNRAQNLRFIYDADGFTAKPRITKIPLFDQSDRTLTEKEKTHKEIEDWQVSMKLAGYGRETKANGFVGTHSFGKGNKLTVTKNKAFVEDAGLKIEYENNKDGMRQNFIVKEKPEGIGQLKLKITASTELTMRVGAEAVVFANSGSEEKMKYNKLKVWDVEKKILTAHFEKVSNKIFAIVVNDENAVYPITIDPLSSSANWTAESDQAGSWFGNSVSTAGDVNGDGYSDVIVGASWYDNGETNEGMAFVYHGSASGLSATSNWTAESNQAYTSFGNPVSTAGDVNGDGYSDVIIGAESYANGETNEGMAFVYHGSASGLSTASNWTAESNQAGAKFGISVSTAGDVNGDGYSDVIVGASQYDNSETDEGMAFVYHGSASGPSATSNWTAESNQAGANFGRSVSTAGDINGDGYSDVIVGALWYDNGETDEGMAFSFITALQAVFLPLQTGLRKVIRLVQDSVFQYQRLAM